MKQKIMKSTTQVKNISLKTASQDLHFCMKKTHSNPDPIRKTSGHEASFSLCLQAIRQSAATAKNSNHTNAPTWFYAVGASDGNRYCSIFFVEENCKPDMEAQCLIAALPQINHCQHSHGILFKPVLEMRIKFCLTTRSLNQHQTSKDDQT